MYSGTSKPRNYSTRNSLRSAQDDNSQPSDDSQQNIESLLNMFQNKPTIQPQDLKASYMNALGFSDVSNYVALNSDSFIRTIGSFYYCLLCGKRARFEREATITSHVENKLHINKLLQLRAYLFSKLPDDNSLNMKALSKFLDRWYEENALTDVMSTLRQYVVEEFNEILQSINPQCYCRLTGSLLTGTSLRYSDINLELIHPNSKLFESDSRAKNSIHHKLIDPDAGVGQQFNNHTIHFDLIANAIETLYKTAGYIQLGYTATNSFCVSSSIQDLTNKVPRLILTHRETNIELEISCYSDSSYKLNSLLRLYLSLDERSRVLSTLVKHWAKICHISEPERGTYAPTTFIILVIYYLQRVSPPILPCLHDLLPQKMKDNQNDKSLIKQLNELNLSDLEEHELKSCDKPNSLVEDSNLHEASLEQLNESEGEDEEGEDEPEAEAEDDNFELNEETVKNLNWKSENHSSIHRLFAGFMMFMIDEFDDTSRVISIRTLKDVTLISKKWNTQVKAIENPLKPKTNLSRTIGAFRTFEYLRQCFKNAFHYLTSIPVQAALRQADPRDYIEFYVNVGRLDFFFEMKEAMRAFPLNNCVADMIRQNLFARDVEVINSVVESCLTRGMDLELLPTSLANYYSSHFLVPLDNAATHFCWLCRRFGHKKPDCPKIHIEKLAQELQFYDHQLDRIVQFDGDFLKLYERDLITPEVARMHQSIVNKLRDTIAEMTGLDCKLELFGSTVNLLGSCDSDLDICMTLKDNPTGKGLNFVKILRQVHEVLIAMQEVMSIEPILSARVPIIRFRYKNFDVDLSMYNQCAIYNSKLLRTYVLIDYRVAQLFYLVKRFAKGCGIADASRGSLSSYAWSLMVIHFLQQLDPPILPVLQEQDNQTKKLSYGVNGWNVWFRKDIESIKMPENNSNLTQLYKRFFLYYGNFDFNQNVISIRTSRILTKFQKSWNGCMMAIEDPFELTYNLSGRLDDPMAIFIINSFAQAYRHTLQIQQGLSARKRIPIEKLFHGQDITGGSPPFRGCRICHKIGHKQKDCPEGNKESPNKSERYRKHRL